MLLGHFIRSTCLKEEALCYKCLSIMKSITGLEKNFGTTEHRSVAVERVDKLLFYQFTPVFYFCFTVAIPFLEARSRLETFIVFSPFPLPHRSPLV